MNRNILFILLSFITMQLSAQTPEFIGRPYLWQNKVALSDLERADASFEFKERGLGFGGAAFLYTIATARSKERLDRTMLPSFVIEVANGIDPSEYYTIVRAEVKKGKRNFLVRSYSMRGKSKDTKEFSVEAEFRRIKDNIFEVILPKDIEPGEYGFIGVGNSATQMGSRIKISCFGVD